MHLITCPECGSKHVRHAKLLGFGERIAALFGQQILRCKDCQHRFTAKVFRFADWRFSRCPRCYRMDLSSWSEEHYSARGWVAFKLYFGARRLRCDYCRVNFAGFRPAKMRSRRHLKPTAPPPSPYQPAAD
jgi:DNA-directed RNA polymerase subunit RPC12/RpoP